MQVLLELPRMTRSGGTDLPRWPHKPEIAGSTPASRNQLISSLLDVVEKTEPLVLP